MINRRELIKRIALGIAGASVPTGVVADSLANIKPIKKARPDPKTKGARLYINGEEYGYVTDVTMESEKSVIDVTDLDSKPTYMIGSPDRGVIDFRIAPEPFVIAALYETWVIGEMLKVKLDMYPMVYEFDAIARNYSITSTTDSLMVVDMSLEVIGAIHIA